MQCALLSKESKLKCFTDNFLTAYKKEIEKGFLVFIRISVLMLS